MSKPIPLTADAINSLLAKQAKQTSTRKGGGRQKKDPTEPREYATWWKLHQSFGVCDNPDCPDNREQKVKEGKAMVSLIKDKNMCRYCFLSGWLSDNSGG